jgi:glycosyltransferase involved in cell wall biosynthesis
MTNTRVLHISANIFPRFREVNFTKDIWKELSKNSEQYHVFCRNDRQRFSSEINENIFLHRIPYIFRTSLVFIFSSFFIVLIVKRYKISHIVVQSPLFGGPAAIFVSKLFKIPVFTELHGDEYFNFLSGRSLRNYILSKVVKFVLMNSTKVRALNNTMKQKLKPFGIEENVVVIPGRVNLLKFSPRKYDYSISGSAIQLISVGRFVKEKNYDQLMSVLLNSNLQFKLVLVGGGEKEDVYRRIILKFNAEDRIQLINWVDQDRLVKLITDSDIYIQSSISEGMPRSILEAMALGMPIISTSVGSIPGVINSNENGILINDIESELLPAIDFLNESISIRESFGNEGYNDVLNKYEWTKVFTCYREQILGMNFPQCVNFLENENR